VCPARLALRVAAKHARDLGDALDICEDRYVGRRHSSGRSFGHEDMPVRARGDLRQMRDREHLMRRGDLAEHITHLLSDSATNAGIDFVEDERRHVVDPGEDCLQREHHAR